MMPRGDTGKDLHNDLVRTSTDHTNYHDRSGDVERGSEEDERAEKALKRKGVLWYDGDDERDSVFTEANQDHRAGVTEGENMAEFWDVYDAERHRTGRIIERAASWGNEAFHLIVHIGIFNASGQMLIQHRARDKHAWADLWDISAGGSAMAGEDSYQAAERETREELGLEISLAGIRPHFSINYTRGFDDFFAITVPDLDIETLTLPDGEVAEIKWASLNEIHQMMDMKTFVPYFPGVIDLLFQTRDNYDGAICQS